MLQRMPFLHEKSTFRKTSETLKESFWTGTIKGNVPVVIGYEAAIFDDVVNPVAAFELTLKPQIEFAPSGPADKDTYTIKVDGEDVTFKDVTTRKITAQGSMTLDHEAYFKTTTMGEDHKFPFYTKKNNVNIFNSDKYKTITVMTRHKKTCSQASP